mmetsp:Transcript_14126/g.23201  ORF Transcript_14126/g.23201 Transcript_14126/m.23201 type:complete len:172 (+) Transcript_14126:69-584(+)
MLSTSFRRAFRPLAAVGAGRCAARSFAANPLDATAALYEDLVSKAVAEFKANEKDVASDLDAELSSNKMVLFMEGTPDAPKSELSMNVVKMLTQVQATNFLSIDVLSHPAILGYTVSKSQRSRAPHLYMDGKFYADHDGLLTKYKSGDLKSIGSEARSSGVFGGELPIASY